MLRARLLDYSGEYANGYKKAGFEDSPFVEVPFSAHCLASKFGEASYTPPVSNTHSFPNGGVPLGLIFFGPAQRYLRQSGVPHVSRKVIALII
jgi:hypothetical protein